MDPPRTPPFDSSEGSTVAHALLGPLRVDAEPSGPDAELVGFERGAMVGRYVVLGQLGRGGMGVVHAAYDPELDRRVALKLLLPRGDGGPGPARLLREAQALARLAHPNVVAVHDVGAHGDHVWIAMELVAGVTLGVWARARPRTTTELVHVLTESARGVAAAHAAGLVHRDLKPDNVMVGDDGRVRVMDFGLAHGRASGLDGLELETTVASGPDVRPELAALALRLTRAGALQGTPGYMSPEQWQGLEATAAADQFCWSVMAWELLYGERPFTGGSLAALAGAVLAGKRRPPPRGRRVPGWLRRVIERGLAVEPARRWPTMDALLAQLARGRIRARILATGVTLAGLLVVGAGGEAWRGWQDTRRTAACEAEAAELASTWDDLARGDLRAAMVATGAPYAATTADLAIPWLDRHSSAWQQARGDACVNQFRRVWDADTFDRALWCLDERRTEFTALVAELGRADETTARRAVTAAARLRSPAPCLDAARLARQPPPPPTDQRAQIEALRGELGVVASRWSAGHYKEGLELAAQVRARAEQEPAWPPLVAAARYLEAQLLTETGAYEPAAATMADNYFAAAHHGSHEIAADSANAMIHIVGVRLDRRADGLMWARHAEIAGELADDPGRLREANRLYLVSRVRHAMGEVDAARELAVRALELRQAALGDDHPDLAPILLALSSSDHQRGDHPAALALQERALALYERSLGADHPNVANTLSNIAGSHLSSGKLDEAGALFLRVQEIFERALGPEHPEVAGNLMNLAAVHRRQGDKAGALALHERALAILEKSLGPEHPGFAKALHNVAATYMNLGQHERALASLERAREIWEKVDGPEHPEVALVLGSTAAVRLSLGQREQGVALLEQALAIFDRHEGQQEGEFHTRFNLAMALYDAPGQRARAVALGEAARDAQRISGDEAALRDIEAWLAKHPAR